MVKAADWQQEALAPVLASARLPSVTLGNLLHLYLGFPVCKVGVIMLLYLTGGEERAQG